MSHVEQLRKGMVLRHEGHLLTVVDFHTAQSGKQKPTVHVKLRALHDGHPVERTLIQLGTIDEVASEVREMQYLYVTGSERVFMDDGGRGSGLRAVGTGSAPQAQRSSILR